MHTPTTLAKYRALALGLLDTLPPHVPPPAPIHIADTAYIIHHAHIPGRRYSDHLSARDSLRRLHTSARDDTHPAILDRLLALLYTLADEEGSSIRPPNPFSPL